MPRNNGLRLQIFATIAQLGKVLILGIQFSSLSVLWFTGCSTNITDTTSNMELISNKPIEQQHAITEFKKVLGINPESEWSHYNLGLAHYNQGEYQQAVQQFEKVIEINPNNIEVHNNLGLAYHNQGKYSKAIIEFEKVIETNLNVDKAS